MRQRRIDEIFATAYASDIDVDELFALSFQWEEMLPLIFSRSLATSILVMWLEAALGGAVYRSLPRRKLDRAKDPLRHDRDLNDHHEC